MKKRFVGHRFVKQAKNRVSIQFISSIFSPLSFQKECESNPSVEQKNATVFANRINWRKIASLVETRGDWWLQKM